MALSRPACGLLVRAVDELERQLRRDSGGRLAGELQRIRWVLARAASWDISPERNQQGARPDDLAGWVSTSEAAQRLGITVRRIQQLAASGKLEAKRVGRAWLFSASDVAKRQPDRR
jgi:excisionase family DNA binding protein